MKVFSLRNPDKIKGVKGENFYYDLIHSLKCEIRAEEQGCPNLFNGK